MSVVLVAPSSQENASLHKVLAIAQFAGVALEHNENVSYGVENMEPHFGHPLNKYPVLETKEGTIFGVNAILRHVVRLSPKCEQLSGGPSELGKGQVDAWLDFSLLEIEFAASPYIANFFSGGAVPIPESSDSRLKELLGSLETRIENKTFLVGERITAADISVAFSLQWVVRMRADDGTLKLFPNVMRHYNTVLQQPESVKVLTAVGSSFGIPAAKKAAPAAVAPVKKEEKKPAAKADDDEDDEPVIEDKKKANPLDTLAPSPFVLDAFKREYSNTDTRKVAAPYFFQNFDNAGFSAFWCKYKYNEESKMQFMTANLIRGWFQRMEGCRKYAFGIALISGTDKVHDIDALWIFRGKGVPDVVLDVEDTELFSWTEIKDINAEKEKITDYLCWEGPTIAKPVLEGKCFK